MITPSVGTLESYEVQPLGNHTPIFRVHYAPVPLTTPVQLPVLTGQVSKAADRWPRHQAAVTVPFNTTVLPGGSLKVGHGYRLTNGDELWADTFKGIVTDVQHTDQATTQIAAVDITGWLDAIPTPIDTVTTGDTITSVISKSLAKLSTWLTPSGWTVSVTNAAGSLNHPVEDLVDRTGSSAWSTIEEITTSAGLDVVCNSVSSNITLRETPPVDPADEVAVLRTGAVGTITSYTTTHSRRWNAVQIRFNFDRWIQDDAGWWGGADPWPKYLYVNGVNGVAQDSTVSVLGPWTMVEDSEAPKSWKSLGDLAALQADATARAARRLAALHARQQNTELRGVPMPLLEPDDVVRVIAPGVDYHASILAVTIPIGPDVMSITTREV